MFRSFDLSGTANDLTATFSYSPASQITQTIRTGDAYAYTAMGNGSTAYGSNGLNQQVSIGGSTATWDANAIWRPSRSRERPTATKCRTS
jgi:hypothetical protein